MLTQIAMGIKRDYTCLHCNYSAIVSGGKDAGKKAVVQTCTCLSCQELTDILIGAYGKEGPTGNSEYDATLNQCQKCDSTCIEPWVKPYQCPKCHTHMKPGNMKMIWD